MFVLLFISVSGYVDDTQFGGIEKARNGKAPFESRADHKRAVIQSSRVSGKQPLPRCIDPSSKESPLTAVGVSADDQIQGQGLQIRLVIFGMMAEQDTGVL